MLARTIACAAVALPVAPSPGQEAQQLSAAQPLGSTYFGASVSVWGDTAVVGHRGDPQAGAGAGSAATFSRVGPDWVADAVLLAPDAAPGDGFGAAVLVQGDRLVVGAPQRTNGSWGSAGAAYVFERTAGVWAFREQLLGTLTGDYMGAALALDGDLLAVGAPSAGISERGAVYAFRYDGASWIPEGRLTATGGFGGDQLGAGLAVRGDAIVAGAPSLLLQGYAVPFSFAGGVWSEGARIQGSLGHAQDRFGSGLALHGDTLVVGAPSTSTALPFEGAAYVFVPSGSGWSEDAVLQASPLSQGQRYGTSVTAFGDALLVGAERQQQYSGPPSAVDVFLRRGGSLTRAAQLVASSGEVGDGFAASVASDGRRVLVGAALATLGVKGNYATGAAYDPGTDTLYACRASFRDLIIMEPDLQSVLIGKLGFDNPQGLAFDPASSTLYGVDVATDQLFTIDTASGAGTAVGPLGFDNVRALTWDPGLGILYGVDAATKQLLSIDPASGAGVALGATGWVAVQGLAFDAGSGTLYGLDRATDTLLVMDPSTGAGTAVGKVSLPAGYCLAFDAGAGVLQAVAPYGPPVQYTIDPQTAATVVLGPLYVLQAGAAYDFELDLTATYCTAGTSAAGCTAVLSASGQASSTLPSGFVLRASGVEGARPGQFFFGSSGRQALPWGNGTSLQCVVPPVVRAGILPAAGTPGACDGTFEQDLDALWCPACPKPGHNPGAGALVQAQFWYRDPLSTSNQTTGLSDAIEFLVGL